VTATAAWLDDGVSEIGQAIVRRAMEDIGIMEMPPGSNRSPRIDQYVIGVGSPLGSPWCAAAVAAWLQESGAAMPALDAGSCSAWVAWSRRLGTWSTEPRAGSVVVYGNKGVAVHMGVIVRIEPELLSVEGNTSIAGDFDPNGVVVTLKRVALSRVLGYVAPTVSR
jgi:hypothetical protein